MPQPNVIEEEGRREGKVKREREEVALVNRDEGNDSPLSWKSAWPKGYKQPHAYQYEAMHKELPPTLEWKPHMRILYEDAPRLPYRRERHVQVKTVLHWGQRKLLMSEIEFLTMYSDKVKDPILLYAGAAPGRHAAYLASLFPSVHFVLVDPNPFSVRPSQQIEIWQEFFTDETARRFSGKDNVLFVSDIRTADPSEQGAEEVEKYVASDMEAQMRWHEIIRPFRSMVKFRLPWGGGRMEYLDGKVYLPVWGPQTTSETRLVIKKDAKRILWDNQKYEDQCFYFNTRTRASLYPHGVKGEGIDDCYDCASEMYILKMYLRAASQERLPNDVLYRKVSQMSYDISRILSKGNRTLAMPQPHPGYRGKMGLVKFQKMAHDKGGVDELHRRQHQVSKEYKKET